MKRFVSLLIVGLLFLTIPGQAKNGQYYFTFEIESVKQLPELSPLISIDNVRDKTVWAYANEDQFAYFQTLGYDCVVLPDPGSLIEARVATSKADMEDWDYYPSFVTYVEMMEQYAADYPTLCRLDTIGTSIQGRLLLAVKISDNVTSAEPESELFYTGTMHGDETTGYILTLRLIDYLLSNYGSDSQVTTIVDNLEIWINPLANPDGTYTNNDSTVTGATRYNDNGVDLNRNFPDPEDGPHPDGHSWQPETVAMMNWAEAHNFVLSANFHGGAEVLNYPWDTWSQRHADDSWLIQICRLYADSVHANAPSGYMTFMNNGITNGYDWYSISGGRQDYMTYFRGGREVTMEISDTKLLPGSQLPAHWDYNRAGLLNYLENGMYGIHGIVTDSVTGLPLPAVVTVLSHDIDSARVFSQADNGDYHRLIDAGTWDLQFKAPGYVAKTVIGVSVSDYSLTTLDVALAPLSGDPVLSISDNDLGPVDPGDAASFHVTLANYGGGNAVNVSATLSTGDSYINVTQPNSNYPVIYAEGGTAQSISNYQFTVSPSCPTMHEVTFQLDISVDGVPFATDYFTITVGLPVEDFESGDFTAYPWENGGDAYWTVVSGGVESGSYCAKSGSITHSDSSELFLTVDIVGDGEIGFYYKVSSESGWDYLRFYIDGTKQSQWSGEVAWTYVSYPVTTGEHTFRWSYKKDGSVSDGSDCSWVDFIQLPPSYKSLTITTGDLPDWTAGVAYSQQLTAEGGTGEYSWLDTSGGLTGTGLTLAATGLLSGTPSSAGLISFIARVSDGAKTIVEKPLSFTINPSVQITSDLMPDGEEGQSYSYQLLASGGTGAKTWTDKEDDLTPFGLTMSTSGLVSGTPTASGTVGLTVNAADAVGDVAEKFFSFDIAAEYICGDADANGLVNISDAVYIVAYIFGGGPAPDPIEAADVDCNGLQNISDAVYLIAFIFGGGPEPCAGCP